MGDQAKSSTKLSIHHKTDQSGEFPHSKDRLDILKHPLGHQRLPQIITELN